MMLDWSHLVAFCLGAAAVGLWAFLDHGRLNE